MLGIGVDVRNLSISSQKWMRLSSSLYTGTIIVSVAVVFIFHPIRTCFDSTGSFLLRKLSNSSKEISEYLLLFLRAAETSGSFIIAQKNAL